MKFTSNCSISQTTVCSPFEAVYGVNLVGPLDLDPIPIEDKFSGDVKESADQIQKLHEMTGANILQQNAKYSAWANLYFNNFVEFMKGDLF